MKIVYQTEALGYSLQAGLSRYVHNLSVELGKLNSEIEFVNIQDSKFKKLQSLFNNKIFRGTDYDLAHITAMHYQPFPAKNYCSTIHDLIVFTHPEFFTLWQRQFYRKNFQKILKTKNFICVSRTTADTLCSNFSISHKNIEVIHEGVSEKFYPDPNQGIRGKYNLKRPFVLFYSTIEPRKNLDLLLKAFMDGRLDSHTDLVVIGKIGWKAAHYNRLFRELEFVKYLGFVSDDDLRNIISISEFYVNPSIVEGFGLPIIEAARCGTRVLCSDIPIFKEVASGIEGVFFFESQNSKDLEKKLLELIKSPNNRSVSRQNYKEFTWKDTALQTVEYYNKLLK